MTNTNILDNLVTMIKKYEADKGTKPLDITISEKLWKDICKLPSDKRRQVINFKNNNGMAIVCIKDVPIVIDGHYIFWRDYKYA